LAQTVSTCDVAEHLFVFIIYAKGGHSPLGDSVIPLSAFTRPYMLVAPPIPARAWSICCTSGLSWTIPASPNNRPNMARITIREDKIVLDFNANFKGLLLCSVGGSSTIPPGRPLVLSLSCSHQ